MLIEEIARSTWLVVCLKTTPKDTQKIKYHQTVIGKYLGTLK